MLLSLLAVIVGATHAGASTLSQTLANPQAASEGRARDVPYPGRITLSVDATSVEQGIFRVAETIPLARSGPFTLRFPQWVPGNHAPTARIERIAGLAISAGGRRLPWTRDVTDMYAFHVRVPDGVRDLAVTFDYLSATTSTEGRVVMTPEMLNLQWFSLVAYPSGFHARRIVVEPRVTLPDGWEVTTQLPVASRAGSLIRFRPVDLEALLDAPLFAGRHFRRYELGSIGQAPVHLDVVADDAASLDASPEAIDVHRRLVAEVGKLFAAAPFQQYRFMLGLTRELGGIGTEHLASSENTRPPRYFSEWQGSALLAHELTHAWNGKARRPRDLWTPDFHEPMGDQMLWIYEGQTQFWAFVLSGRSGLMTHDQVLDVYARLAAYHQSQPGRAWRPLLDTGNDAIMTNELVDEPWPSWHRALNDSYTEANLIWLEADGVIRELTHDTRGLDDFARMFFAGGGERPSLYDFHAVVRSLNRVAPFDWARFFRARLESTDSALPVAWLARSGYRLVFSRTPTEAFLAHEVRSNELDLRHSLGIVLRRGATGEIREVLWNSPAFSAGLVGGATILSVNDAAYTSEKLLTAIAQSSDGADLRLGVRNRGRDGAITIRYRGGLRYPRLQRDSALPDRLEALLRARASPPS